jgi:NifU-like protein involved in Fe-S cluster formation
MPELSDLYSERILELAANIGRIERLPTPQASASAHSKLCGSTISVDLNLADGRVTEYGQTVKACLLGQAASAVMAAHVVGSTPDELRRVRAGMRAMLKDNGPPPSGKWAVRRRRTSPRRNRGQGCLRHAQPADPRGDEAAGARLSLDVEAVGRHGLPPRAELFTVCP